MIKSERFIVDTLYNLVFFFALLVSELLCYRSLESSYDRNKHEYALNGFCWWKWYPYDGCGSRARGGELSGAKWEDGQIQRPNP
jgi:hypothetical protein